MIPSRSSWSRGRCFDSAGTRLFFTDEGCGSPVMLVHGFAVSGDLNFRLPGITRALRRRYRVISLDLRGHGQSEKPHSQSAYGLAMVHDVGRLLDHLELERAHLVGYSLGGFVALKLACISQARLSSVAVLGAGFEGAVGDGGGFLAGLAALATALESGRGVGPLSEHLGGARLRPSWRHRAWVRFVTEVLNDKRALAAVVRSAPNLAVAASDLEKLSLPLACISGERDALAPGARSLAAHVPHAKLTLLPGADHVQAPLRGELRVALEEFLQEADSMRGGSLARAITCADAIRAMRHGRLSGTTRR